MNLDTLNMLADPEMAEDFYTINSRPTFFGSNAASKDYRGRMIKNTLIFAGVTGGLLYYFLK